MPNWKKLITSGSDANLNSLTVVGAVSAANITLSDKITHDGDTNTHINLKTDEIVFTAGGTRTVNIESGNLTINDTGADYNFKVESANSAHMLVVDASEDRVGIGTNSPSHTLSVVGPISGSTYYGDGSNLTGISTDVSQTATIADSFSNQTSVATSHNFGTKNVQVTVYDNNDAMIIPDSIVTTDTNTVTTTFDSSTTGRVVVGKAGHIVSGSTQTYRQSITGASSYAVTHSLSEDYPIVQVYSSSRAQVIPSEIITTSANALDITFTSTFNGTVVVKK